MIKPEKLSGYSVELHLLNGADTQVLNGTCERPNKCLSECLNISEISKQILDWRNSDFVRLQMVNQALISQAEHNQWFNGLAHKHNQLHFVVSYKNEAIGVINIIFDHNEAEHGEIGTGKINTDEINSAEVGLYIGHSKFQSNLIAFAPSLVINDFAFETLKVKSLKSKVRNDNLAALKYNQQLGYQLKPLNNEFTEIQLTADNYYQATKQIKNWLSRG